MILNTFKNSQLYHNITYIFETFKKKLNDKARQDINFTNLENRLIFCASLSNVIYRISFNIMFSVYTVFIL